MSQSVSTESIAAALFALAQSVNTPQTPFVIMSRRWRHFKDVPPDQMPAFFQSQLSGETTRGGVRGLPVHNFKFRWCVYLPASQSLDDVVSPVMNEYYDALSNVLIANLGPQSRNTLGGIVVNCYEDGQVFIDEGLLDTPSLIVIPITVITGF